MIKKVFSLFVIVALMFSCTSNKKGGGNENKKRVITVSIVPQKTFVQKIAGNDFDINVLIPPGTSPETGSLLISQVKDIVNSDIWFRIGLLEFEYSWHDKIAQTNAKMKIVDFSDGLDLIAELHEHSGRTHESGIDPHIWLSPVMVKQMAKKIADELMLINPEKAAEYYQNYIKFIYEIDLLDIDIRNSLSEYRGKKFIIFHPSLSYFARDYGLIQCPLEADGKEPTPQQMADIVRTAKAENIKVIYVQNELDQTMAHAFAEEIKGKVIALDPLSHEWEENMRLMTKIFIENFNGTFN